MFENRIKCLFVIVLSFLLGLVTKFNGMMRTVVIASKASEAILVVKPLGEGTMPTLDVAHRTDVGTNATFHAAVFVYMESLVGDEYFLEEAAHHLGEKPRDWAFYQAAYSLLAIEYLLAYNGQLLCRLLFLAYLTLLGVYVHEWKSYVRLWHDERIAGCYV